ncbi:MAG TPA: Gmad2 immunoglobulin-like domain-containing protein [Patescibacteria group bacterium]|nr:Gmad2 immunoglobulin-like domain-containing protein [Patescibacteria group bacterium]
MDPINPTVPEIQMAQEPVVSDQIPDSDSKIPADSHWVTIASMAVFVLLSLGAVAFLYYQNQQLKSMLASYQTPVASPTPVATIDPTANWKTYTDAKKTFSFKYPASLQLKTFEDGSLILTATDGPDKIIHEFRVNNYTISTSTTLYQFIYEGGVGDNYGKGYLNANNVSLTFKDVSKNSSYKIWEPSSWPSANGILINFIQNNNQLIWFSLEGYNPGGTPIPYEKENVQIYNQILSTFKFTDQISDTPTVTSPAANTKISSPLTITGTVPTGWMFEGSFPIRLVDSTRTLVAQGTAKEVTPGSWQSGKPVAFSVTLPFSTTDSTGFLILTNDNPSGDPANSKTFEVPVKY